MTSYKIYGARGCGWCLKAQELLRELGLPYEYHVVHEDLTVPEFKGMFPGKLTVPQVVDPDGKHIGGYNELLTLLM